MSQMQNIIKDFILENFLPGENPANLTADTELRESGILDSLSTLKLVTFLEQRFNIELDANDLGSPNLSSLNNIERLVQSKLTP